MVPGERVRARAAAALCAGIVGASLLVLPQPAHGVAAAPMVVVGEDAPRLERLAAAEVQRYLYHLTGDKLEIRTDAEIDEDSAAPMVTVGQRDTNAVIADMADDGLLPGEDDSPGPEGYVIRTVTYGGADAIAVMGTDDNGTLYGSYELLERYGARFYIGRDVLPEHREPFAVKQLDITEKPAVARRGLLPWHDFLNGPSGYSYEDFESYINQLAKMKMNTLVLHNYGGGYPAEDINEPFMDFECDGEHPDAWLDTSVDNDRWGMAPFRTGGLAFRSGDYFRYGVMGSDAARYTKEQPDSQKYIFAKAKAMMRKTIRHAQSRGVEVVLGTDFDILPASMRQAGCEPLDPEVLKARLDDILRTYPTLKYIQMYYNEVSDTSTADAIEAYRLMRDYLAEKRPWARLVTGSWFQETRFPEMDAALPRDITFSTLLPHDMTVRPEWEDVAKKRSAWPVPWMEFDGGLSEPQLAVGRMAEQLPKLRAAGVQGIIGILWREMPAEANVSYLAQDLWRNPGDALPAADFYRDYAAHVFGGAAAQAGAKVLQALEDGGVYPGVGALPLTTPEYVGWTRWADAQAPTYSDHYDELQAAFRELDPLVSTASGEEALNFYTQFMRWGSEYWAAQHRVPAAVSAAVPKLTNYFLVNSGESEPENDLRADYGHYGTTNTYTTSGTVENDFGYPQAIRSERWSSQVFGYRFDVPEGYERYRVELYFQEGYFGVVIPGDPVGRRVFDITINGTLVEEDFDIAETAGGSLKGVRLVFEVPVADELDIQFRPVVSNPKIDIVRAYPIDAEGEPLPKEFEPGRPLRAWGDIKASGFRDAIDAYQHMVRDLPTLGGLLSAAGGRWYETAEGCGRCAPVAYKDYERQVVEELPVAPPDNLVVRGMRGGASLSWRPYDGKDSEIAGYQVYRKPVSGGGFERLTAEPVSGTSFVDEADGGFVYAVSAVDRGGDESPLSYEESVEAGSADDSAPRVLLIPRNLEAVRGESLRVTALAMDGRAPAEVSATLHYRSLGEGKWKSVEMRRSALARPYAFFADVPAGDVGKESLEYYVSATDGANTGYAPAGAPEVTGSVLVEPVASAVPGTVRGLSGSWDGQAGGVMLAWEPTSPLANEYNIYRSTDAGFTPSRATYVTYVPAGQKFFLDVNTEPGVTYYYKIEPESIAGRTGRSQQVSVRAPSD